MPVKNLIVLSLALWVAGCATQPAQPTLPPANKLLTDAEAAGTVAANTLPEPPGVQDTPIKPDPLDLAARPMIYKGNDLMVKLPKPAANIEQKAGGMVALNFEQVPLTDLVQSILGKLLKVDYSIDAPLKGEVTLHTAEPVPTDRLLPLLESFLLANGALMVKGSDGVYHIGCARRFRCCWGWR